MALATFKCTECEQTFTAPNWTCADGAKHQVAPKEYFAPIPSLRVYASEEHTLTTEEGQKRTVPARLIEFAAGRYTTSDAQEQHGLDKKVVSGPLIDKARWEVIFYSKEDRLAEREKQLAERESRITKQENSLLDQVKSQKGARV